MKGYWCYIQRLPSELQAADQIRVYGAINHHMKKVGIVACYNNHNYGSMLQAYATYMAIRKLGYECEFITYHKKHTIIEIVRFIPRVFNCYLMREKWRLLEKQIQLQTHIEMKRLDQIRQQAFARFSRKYFNGKLSKTFLGYAMLKQGSAEYDVVLVGSDQLWFPAGLPTNFYNLMFVADEVRKVTYATSFGVSKIPIYQNKRTIDYINRIDYIAVREESGKRLIKELTGRDVEVVLDPTLLFSASDWNGVFLAKPIVTGDYIFCYFLGSNPAHRKAVVELREQTGIRLYDMPHIDEFVPGDLDFADEHLYNIDPEQFISLIRHAKYICTDSFHCSVFSIIYGKQFVVFNRYSDSIMSSRNTRITNLLSICGLENQRFKTDILGTISTKINYDEVYTRIDAQKKMSWDYLRHAFN